MDRKHVVGGKLLGLGLGLLVSIGACTRSEATKEVRGIEQTGDDVAGAVHQAAETAKRSAERVRDGLPAATERAKDEIVAVGESLKAVLNTAGDKVRDEASETRDTARENAPKQD